MPLYPRGADGPQGPQGVQGPAGDTMVKRAWNYTTNSSGVWSGTIPADTTVLTVTPRTAGEFLSAVSLNGTTLTITFRKFKTAGLGITLGTLLTVSIFEDSPGTVNFDLICMSPMS